MALNVILYPTVHLMMQDLVLWLIFSLHHGRFNFFWNNMIIRSSMSEKYVLLSYFNQLQ
jgi:hypothetical protein